VTHSAIIFLTGLVAGAQNALAGGGSFITLAALVFTGLDPRAANITSTVALFPGMVTTGIVSSKTSAGIGDLSLKTLIVISMIGGAVGGALLIVTPSALFAALVPWLVLFATTVFFWGSFIREAPAANARLAPGAAATAQFAIAVYGGYFGGGIGFLMLALMTVARMAVRQATATKNVLATAMNASAFLIFLSSRDVDWRAAILLGVANIIGGYAGVLLLPRVNERWLRIAIVALGIVLTVGLFVRGR